MKKIISLRKGTCTYRAAEHLLNNNENFKDYQIIEVNSFNEGISMIKDMSDNKTRILIPDLSDEYSKAVMDSVLARDMDNIFWYDNPPLYLAKNKKAKTMDLCATLHTLKNLVDSNFTFIYQDNTQDSARYCAEGNADTCITNQNGIDSNDLIIVKELKKMKVMWVPFLIQP
ncbi:MAG: hypothetical protein QG585_599 [Patescibacteria group bacterium]|jgi:hypothetical protein|nr:hypothetical protein [Patescibacteria group bacterium]